MIFFRTIKSCDFSGFSRHVIVAMLVVSSLFVTGVTHAANYLGSGYFSTKSLTRCHSGSYYSAESQYAAGTWSSSTDIDMYSSCSNVHIYSQGADFGATNWAGYAYICSTNGYCDNQTAWNGTFSGCVMQLNQYHLKNNTINSIKSIALHELGHCYSLGHQDNDSTSVMHPTNVINLTPNQADKNRINTRY